MSARIFVTIDGTWGSADEGENIILLDATASFCDMLENTPDDSKFALALEYASDEG